MASTHEYLLSKYGVTLTFVQAAHETGIYWQTIREMCLRGDINTVKVGRKWILTTKALAEFLDGMDTKQAEPEPIQLTGRGHRKIV